MPHALTPSQVNSINLMTTYSVDKVFVALLSFFYCMQLLSMKERAQIKEEEDHTGNRCLLQPGSEAGAR